MPASQAKSRWLIPRSRRHRRHRRSMSPTVGLVCKSVMPRPQPRARAVGNDLSPNRPDDRGRGSWIHRPIAPVPTEVTMTIDTFPVPADLLWVADTIAVTALGWIAPTNPPGWWWSSHRPCSC